MHAALPYLCPSNYPTLATPLLRAVLATKRALEQRRSTEKQKRS